MPSLKEIRTRISTVISTRQITSAMKMVAAARLRKAQETIIQLRPYAGKLQNILETTLFNMNEADPNPYTESREPNRVLVVMVTSNRGLCGAFNANLIRYAVSYAHENYTFQIKSGNLHFLTLGKKGNDFMKSKKYPLYGNDNKVSEKPVFSDVAALADNLTRLYLDQTFDHIVILYNQFKNAAVQILTAEQFLPVLPPPEEELALRSKEFQEDYIYEPGQDELIRELIPKSLKVQLFRILADSYAAEQGARMTAMHQATDNASDLLRELRLNYNKARQAAITKEILEIVGGAEALSK